MDEIERVREDREKKRIWKGKNRKVGKLFTTQGSRKEDEPRERKKRKISPRT